MNQAPSVPVSPIRQIPGDNGAGGFRINLAEIAAAQQAPSIDARSFAMSEAAVGAAVGNAAQGLSEGGLRIASEIFESTNRRKVDNAASALAAASQDIAMEVQKEQDPNKWVGIFNTHAAKWESTLLNDKELSPAARDAISAKVADWKIRGSSGTLRAAFDHSIKLESQGLEGKRITAAAAGDWDTAEAVTREQESRGLIGADTAARQRVQTASMKEAKEKEAAFNSQYDAVHKDPKGWKAANPERPETMDAVVYDRLVNEADSVIHANMTTLADSLTNAVASGEIQSPAAVDEWEKDNPDITPVMRKLARDHVIRMRDATAREAMAANAPEIASQLRSEAKMFDPKRDSMEKYYALRLRIAELPAGIEGDVSQILEAKSPDRIAAMKPPSSLVALGDDILHSMFVNGDFGSFDNGTGVNQRGEPVAKPGESPDEVYKRNQRQYQDAIVRKSKLGGAFEKWLKLHPQATEKQAQAKIYELMPEGTRARILDRRDRPAPVDTTDKTTAGTGDNIDLPGGSGAPTGAGILPAPGEPAPQSGMAVWVADKTKSAEVIPMTADDIDRWKSAGEKPAEVWDAAAAKFVTLPPSKLIPGRHHMPTGLLP